jgi:hypothetical protein
MRSHRVVVWVVAAGVVSLALTAALRESRLALSLGVTAGAPVASLQPDQVVCQRPIVVPAGGDFETVVASLGTYSRPGAPLLVTVENMSGGLVAMGRLAGGYPDIGRRPQQRIKLDRTVRAERVAVCIRNSGRRRVAVYGGNIDLAARSSSAYVNGNPIGADLSLEFEREPRSIASMAPLLLERAALFRFPGSGAWTYLGLAILLAVACPWLLLRSVHSASDASGIESSRRAP